MSLSYVGEVAKNMSNKKWKGKICKKSNHKIGEFCLIEKEKKRGEWLTSYLNKVKTNTQIKREREREKGKENAGKTTGNTCKC